MALSDINQVIRARKSAYPAQYINKPIAKEIIQELLINANHAPTHRLTEPWRFKVFTGEGRIKLGEFLSRKYQEITPDYNESKSAKIKTNPSKAGAVIAIIVHRDPQERIPEWEEVAAVAMAVQNIWIALNQYQLGGYWSSPALTKYLGEHVTLQENEACIGFFYLGHTEPNEKIITKKPIEDKVQWFDK